jgi:hypothetical protein
MKLPSILISSALVIGIAAIITLFIVPGFQGWFFLFEIIAFAALATGITLRAQPPK